MIQPVILDTSCWIEYFLGSPLSEHYAHHVKNAVVKTSTVIVPTLCLFEVSRALLKKYESQIVLSTITTMQQQMVIPLDQGVATSAAQLAVNLNLSSADAIIYATALQNNATLFTHDADLKGLDRVHYIEKNVKSIS